MSNSVGGEPVRDDCVKGKCSYAQKTGLQKKGYVLLYSLKKQKIFSSIFCIHIQKPSTFKL